MLHGKFNAPQKNMYICINCDNGVRELYKKLNYNAIKPLPCNNCHKIADKYVEFEPVITLVDALLLSKQSYRHIIYNNDFKLHWKLSLVLLLLESFALWRRKHDDLVASASVRNDELLEEKGFYICCLENIFDYIIVTILLLTCTFCIRYELISNFGLRDYTMKLLKAIAIANFSKFFILPIMVWRDNTTEAGADIHNLLVVCHHLCALIFAYSVVSRTRTISAVFIVIPFYIFKEILKQFIFSHLIEYL